MMSSATMDLDFIEELRLRRWARENYVPRTERSQSWHQIIHDEMGRKETESDAYDVIPQYA